MKSTPRTRRGAVARIAVVAIGLISPVVAVFAAQPGASTAGKSWNRPVLVVASGPTTTLSPNGKSWN